MALHLPGTLPTLSTVTGRFLLTPFGVPDVEPLARILANDDVWSQGYGDGGPRPATHDELVRYIRYRYDGLPVFAIHYTCLPGGPLFAGTTGITEAHPEFDRVKVGRTVINPAFWGTRVNHEVKVAVFDWLFAAGAGRIECDVDPRNKRSLRSLNGLGFTIEGARRRSSQRADRTWRDMIVLSLLVEEWPQARERAVLALHSNMERQVAIA